MPGGRHHQGPPGNQGIGRDNQQPQPESLRPIGSTWKQVSKEHKTERIQEKDLTFMERRDAEDEFVYQNSFKINMRYYASLDEKKAFVMSHGRHMMILKIVGYAENVVVITSWIISRRMSGWQYLFDLKRPGWGKLLIEANSR